MSALHKIIRDALSVSEKLPPLKEKKNPAVAAFWAGALGGLGLSIYLNSLIDFIVPFGMLLLIWILGIPTGEVLSLFTPIFWGIYAYRRVKASNQKLDAQKKRVVDVEIVSSAPLPVRLPIRAKADKSH